MKKVSLFQENSSGGVNQSVSVPVLAPQ